MLFVTVFEKALFRIDFAFAEPLPECCAVNAFAVDGQPLPHCEQNFRFFVRDCTVGFWADVDKQIAVFGDDINKVADNLTGGFVFVIRPVTPGGFADGGIRLPIYGGDSG